MREAVGGAYLYYIVIGFLVIYIFFMGFVMNYASSYRAANYVVTQIETCQAQNNNDCAGKSEQELRDDIKNLYHYIESKNGGMKICCINNLRGSVYRVILPVDFEVPLLGSINWISVKTETKTIMNVSCDSSNFSAC